MHPVLGDGETELWLIQARKEVTDVSWFSREVGNDPRGALSVIFFGR
jgi:hypothetical protein